MKNLNGEVERLRTEKENVETIMRQKEQDKLLDKNNEFEKAKHELESKLRDTEIQKKNFEMAFNNSDRLLAEKDRFISNMKSEMKKELDEMRRIDAINKKEIQELKNQLEQMRSKVSI